MNQLKLVKIDDEKCENANFTVDLLRRAIITSLKVTCRVVERAGHSPWHWVCAPATVHCTLCKSPMAMDWEHNGDGKAP